MSYLVKILFVAGLALLLSASSFNQWVAIKTIKGYECPSLECGVLVEILPGDRFHIGNQAEINNQWVYIQTESTGAFILKSNIKKAEK